MDEVAEALKNPDTGRPYPCVAKIKDTNDIKQANNNAEPLVYNPSHEFTKSIGQLVSKIVGDDFVLEQPEKEKLLSKIILVVNRKGGRLPWDTMGGIRLYGLKRTIANYIRKTRFREKKMKSKKSLKK
ncbi:MAG: hypothetical protein ACLTX3_07035 [Lachnospiraceae bacterium]